MRIRAALLLAAALAGCGDQAADGGPRVETVAQGLRAPWDLAFLPDGRALITERAGTVRLLDGGDLRDLGAVDRVAATGEAGLLGIALDPGFEPNRLLYVYRTTGTGNEVVRMRLVGGRLVEDAVLVDGIAAAAIHDGGRIRFGPDDDLYITTGDAAQPDLAQDPRSLNGKILRVAGRDAREGERLAPEVVSLGHRNPQGLAWDPEGRLVAPEHGPDGDDEVNVIEPGANYGWPVVRGSEHGDFRAPVAVYEDSIAPSGAAFHEGDLYVAALRGEQLRHLRIAGGEATLDEALLEGELGRLRTVVAGPDGALYVLTNNTDGRGNPREGDDRLVRITPG